jgi:mannose-1-phosphate guanylyltransferase/mannose-6-phosphate isomerase
MIIPAILSGGSGSRLWPLSRKSYPKQFLPLMDGQSLFEMTCLPTSNALFASPIVIANDEHRFLVAESLQGLGIKNSQIILEPIGRNTAAACAIAALNAVQTDKDALVLVLPSDHIIQNQSAFLAAVEAATDAAMGGAIVTFGIKATSPHTGYGYIETSTAEQIEGALSVTAFHEKPAQDVVQGYLASGQHYWNGGLFLFKASVMLEAFAAHAPEVLHACEAALTSCVRDLDFMRLPMEAFAKSPDISLDYAIIEKAAKIACVPLDAGWDDLGSFPSLGQILAQDENGNASHGDVILHDSHNSLVYSQEGCVALAGVQNLIVVNTRDATLVTTKDRAQEVKAIVELLRRENRSEADSHVKVHRPWGWYEQLAMGNRFQVKCIMVKPGAQLSLQSHKHRAEHWVVVAGTVEVTRNDETLSLSENQSTYIPLGAVHRLANRGMEPALLIEVQSGSYLGEDDIVRYEDVYGRV